MLKAGTLRTENPGVVPPALLDLGIYSLQAGNGGKNLQPGCVFEVSCAALWAVHQGTEDIQVLWGVTKGVPCPL